MKTLEQIDTLRRLLAEFPAVAQPDGRGPFFLGAADEDKVHHHNATARFRIPVPYVNDWTAESREYPKREPRLGNKWAVFTAQNRGVGKPLLKLANVVRQREIIFNSWCQVCAQEITGPRVLYSWPGSHVIKEPDGRRLFMEPWTCPRCAVIALLCCPGIRLPDIEGTLLIELLHDWEIAYAMIKPRGTIAKTMGAGESLVGYAKVLAIRTEPIKREALLELVR